MTLPPPPGSKNPILVGVSGDSPTVETVLQYPFRMFLPDDLAAFVQAGLRSCHDKHGKPLPDGEALAVIASAFLENLNDPEIEGLKKLWPTLERDGWRCTMPTCTRRAYLHRHHMRFRSDCGPDDHWNLTTLCYVHHDLVHGSIQSIAVSGSAPNELLWEIGRRPRKPPLIVFRSYRRAENPEARALAESDVQRILAAFNVAWQSRFAQALSTSDQLG